MEDINTFQKELTRFHLSIPDDIRLSDQSIAKYIASPERSGYVFLHTHLSVGHIELYRFALPGILDPKKNNLLRRLPQDFVKRAKKQAVAHALCTGRFCVAIQKEAERLAKAGKPCLAGDATIPHLVTESLRVFLIAMQHRMYENLTEDTTAPLWRFQPPDESYIRSLIEDGLLKVSAPWSPILVKCQQSVSLHIIRSNMALFGTKFFSTQTTLPCMPISRKRESLPRKGARPASRVPKPRDMPRASLAPTISSRTRTTALSNRRNAHVPPTQPLRIAGSAVLTRRTSHLPTHLQRPTSNPSMVRQVFPYFSPSHVWPTSPSCNRTCSIWRRKAPPSCRKGCGSAAVWEAQSTVNT